jgi:hypothetical protein
MAFEKVNLLQTVLTITQLTEKRTEFNSPIYIAFVDYIIAFNKVNRNILWQILKLKGFPQHLI